MFRATGQKRLHAAVCRTGGSEHWAQELGVPVSHRQPGLQWTEERMRFELRELLREHHPPHWPGFGFIEQHGPPGLASALARSGGVVRWAREMGMPLHGVSAWTDELVEQELRRLIGHTNKWPAKKQFLAVGYGGLLEAVYRGRGAAWWANRLAVEHPEARPRRSLAAG